MDLREFYKQVKRQPTPGRVFMEDIAKACGVSPTTVKLWIYGRVTPEKLKREKIAEMLQVPVVELFPNVKSDEV